MGQPPKLIDYNGDLDAYRRPRVNIRGLVNGSRSLLTVNPALLLRVGVLQLALWNNIQGQGQQGQVGQGPVFAQSAKQQMMNLNTVTGVSNNFYDYEIRDPLPQVSQADIDDFFDFMEDKGYIDIFGQFTCRHPTEIYYLAQQEASGAARCLPRMGI